ncbi:hypothetical protein EMMF5_006464 [Cystobasidiomycetes sp. EMM_F5]
MVHKASDAIDTSPVIASEIVPLSLEPEIAAAVSSSSSSPLTDLPTDVLLLIRSHIHTLAGLVHFSQTCTTLRRLYNEDLWRGACIAAGFGLPTEYDLTWGGVAAAVVADAAGMNWRGADDDDDDDDEYEAMYRSWPASDYTQADSESPAPASIIPHTYLWLFAEVYEPLRESNIQPAVLEQQDTPLQLDEVGTIGWDLLRGKDLKDTISYGMIDVQPVLRHPSLAFRLATQPHVDSLDARFSHHTLDTHEDFCVENQNGVCIYDLMLPYAEL